jgi:hypothetical protein
MMFTGALTPKKNTAGLLNRVEVDFYVRIGR